MVTFVLRQHIVAACPDGQIYRLQPLILKELIMLKVRNAANAVQFFV